MTYKEAAAAINMPVRSIGELDPAAVAMASAAIRAVRNWEDQSPSVAVHAFRDAYKDAGDIITGKNPNPIRAALENAQQVASACLRVIAGWDETACYAGAPFPTDADAPPANADEAPASEPAATA